MLTKTRVPEIPLGVKISAALLVSYGALFGVAAITGAVAVLTLGSRRQGGTSAHLWAGFLGYCAVLALFAYTCFWAAFGLYQLSRRARRVSVGLGLFLLIFGIWILADIYSPPRPGSFHGDDSFGVLMTPFLILPGAWLCVSLSLPRSAEHFAGTQE